MINSDAVDFSERRPEEVISFFWRSVYIPCFLVYQPQPCINQHPSLGLYEWEQNKKLVLQFVKPGFWQQEVENIKNNIDMTQMLQLWWLCTIPKKIQS